MPRLRQLWGRVRDYVRHDLREIITPSSLPDPPGYVPPPKVPLRVWLQVMRQSVREYFETWNAEKLRERLRERHGEDPVEAAEAEAAKRELKGLMEEFGDAARGGASAVRPFLQNLWKTRAAAYRDAVQQFIQGYKEGFQEANAPEVPAEVAREMEQQRQQQQQQGAAAAAAAAGAEGQQDALQGQSTAAGATIWDSSMAVQAQKAAGGEGSEQLEQQQPLAPAGAGDAGDSPGELPPQQQQQQQHGS